MTDQEKRFIKSLTTSELPSLESILEQADKDQLELTFDSNVRILLAISYDYSTITDLARHIGLDRGYVSCMLSGKYKIYKGKNINYLIRIARALEVDVYTLLFIDLRTRFYRTLNKIIDEP